MDFTANPCENFEQYVCGNLDKVSDKTDHLFYSTLSDMTYEKSRLKVEGNF